MTRPVIRQRIGKRARPGGIVVHIVAVPTGRLIDKFDAAPDDLPTPPVHEVYDVELEPGEIGLCMLPYDGDTGRLIRPPKRKPRPPNLVATVAVLVLAVVINVTVFVHNIINHEVVGWWFAAINGACIGASLGALYVVHRARRRR